MNDLACGAAAVLGGPFGIVAGMLLLGWLISGMFDTIARLFG